MLGVVKWAYFLALGIWLGTIVFFSFFGAPGIFGAFPESQRAEAGRIVGVLFQGYYRIGYVCGAVLLVTGIILLAVRGGGMSIWAASAILAALMFSANLYAGMSIQPRAHELRPQLHAPAASPEVKREFDRLHRRAVQLNVLVLLDAVVLTALAATRLQP